MRWRNWRGGRTREGAIHEARPRAVHRATFHAYPAAKGSLPKHVGRTAARARRVLERAGAVRMSNQTLSRTLRAQAGLRSEGLGAETVNHHVRAVKSFVRRLWWDGVAREHAGVSGRGAADPDPRTIPAR